MTTSGLMTAAMCYRVKYREYGDEGKPIKRHLHVGVLGVDKKNRGGAYPGGLRCKTLCQTVVTGGFMKEEVTEEGLAGWELASKEGVVRGQLIGGRSLKKDELVC